RVHQRRALRKTPKTPVITWIPFTPLPQPFCQQIQDSLGVYSVCDYFATLMQHIFQNRKKPTAGYQRKWSRGGTLCFQGAQLPGNGNNNSLNCPLDCRPAEGGNTGRLH